MKYALLCTWYGLMQTVSNYIQHFPYSRFSDVVQLGKWGSMTEDFVPIYVD